MKTKQEHIDFWIQQANDDWEAVFALLEKRKFLQSLFFAHLVIEKICKASWIKDNVNNIPPRTHNLIYILSQTKVDLDDFQTEFLLSLNRFQIEGRYPDYVSQLYKICNEDFTKEIINQTEKIKICLLNKVQ